MRRRLTSPARVLGVLTLCVSLLAPALSHPAPAAAAPLQAGHSSGAASPISPIGNQDGTG